jgi:hypothetical protein
MTDFLQKAMETQMYSFPLDSYIKKPKLHCPTGFPPAALLHMHCTLQSVFAKPCQYWSPVFTGSIPAGGTSKRARIRWTSIVNESQRRRTLVSRKSRLLISMSSPFWRAAPETLPPFLGTQHAFRDNTIALENGFQALPILRMHSGSSPVRRTAPETLSAFSAP